MARKPLPKSRRSTQTLGVVWGYGSKPMKPVLSAPHFQNEEAAFAYVEVEAVAHWPGVPALRRGRAGRQARPSLWKCYACRKPFTIRMGSVF